MNGIGPWLFFVRTSCTRYIALQSQVNIKEQGNKNPLTGLGLLHKICWTLGNEIIVRFSLPFITTVNLQCLIELIITYL